jgi:hypothetical protein
MEFAPSSATASDPRLALALAAALGALITAALMLVATLTLRIAGRAARAARHRSLEAWRPLFARALAGDTVSAQPVRRRDARVVMLLFEQLALSVRGEGVDRLAEFARRCGLARWALAGLRRGRLGDRLLATSVLGHLGHVEAFEELAALARQPDPVLSIAAARALLHLNPARAAALVLRLARRRPDWPAARLVVALREADSPHLWNPLGKTLEESEARDLPRMLELLAAPPSDVASRLARPILAAQAEPAVIAACLRFVAGPGDRRRVCALLRHRDAGVRLAAVQALGRIASEEDLPRLAHALSDLVWPVRQAAADALVGLPFVDEAWVMRLRRNLSDRYAAEALRRAIAERR